MLRRWWPVLLAIVVSLFVQKVLFEPHYEVSGHASEHLSSASAPFGAFVLAFVLLYATPRARRQLLVLATGAAWLTATVLVLVGNVRVIDELANHSGAAAVDSAHDLANVAPWLGALAALGLVVAFGVARHVSRAVAIGAVFATIVVPPWIVPGAGVVVLAVARAIAFEREQRSARQLAG